MIFYAAFGVSIINYLDLSEIITSFFDIILLVVITFVYSSIQNYLIKNKVVSVEMVGKRNKILTETNLWKIIKLYFDYLLVLIVFGIIIISGLLIWRWFIDLLSYWTIFILGLLFVLAIIFIIVDVEIDRKNKINQPSLDKKRIIKLSQYGLFLLGLIFLYTIIQVNLVRFDKSTLGTSIVLDTNSLFVSDSSNYYIGKTKNFIFIYHEKEMSVDAIPMARVKQITVKRNFKKPSH